MTEIEENPDIQIAIAEAKKAWPNGPVAVALALLRARMDETGSGMGYAWSRARAYELERQIDKLHMRDKLRKPEKQPRAKSGQMKPALKSIYAVTCCTMSRQFPYKAEALQWLWKHIKRYHKSRVKEIEQQARLLARSQNGRGYFDSDKNDGWNNVHATFREAWCASALEELVRQTGRQGK